MDVGAKKWLYNEVHKNLWKVEDFYDFDDLVQDGEMCYARVLMKYQRIPNRVRLTPHIMALFKTTFTNHIHDLAKYRTRNEPLRVRVSDMGSDGDTENDIWDHVSRGIDVFDFERLIGEAPTHVAKLLRAIMAAGSEFLLAKPYSRRGARRETTNERLCSLIGEDPQQVDLATELHDFLTSS
jgi:hypothetical protein